MDVIWYDRKPDSPQCCGKLHTQERNDTISDEKGMLIIEILNPDKDNILKGLAEILPPANIEEVFMINALRFSSGLIKIAAKHKPNNPKLWSKCIAEAKKKFKVLSILYLFLIIIIMNNVRSFLVLALIGPFFFAFNVRLMNKYIENNFVKRVINLLILAVGIGIGSFYFGGESAQKYLAEAEVTQKDFQNNPVYKT